MIKFKAVRAKNFLSIGNEFKELVLGSHKNTLVYGQNGQGKSALLDSLFYALFGKPYRDIKISQLINSINGKGLLTEVEFEIGKVDYKIIRGQKPNIFEIYKNGELVTEEGSTRDYQKVLEQQILKLNPRTFRQIVMIGSATYVPFMQLKAAERRNVIEDILDISIFSSMSEIASKTVKELKSKVQNLEQEISIRKESARNQKTLVESLEDDAKREQELRNEKTKQLEADLNEARMALETAEAEIQNLERKIVKLDETENQKSDCIKAASKINTMIDQVVEKVEFFMEHSECPSCSQEIPSELSSKNIKELHQKNVEYTEKKEKLRSMYDKLVDKIEGMKNSQKELQEVYRNKSSIEEKIRSNQKQLVDLSKEENKSEETMKKAKLVLKETVDLLLKLSEEKSEHQTTLQNYTIVANMLKDSGIKAKIISTFVPIMNELINKHLQKFEMFVNFELDETFNETIKSRYRDMFSYNSFSEGEKQKIDLSILFAWREIAMLKNSVSCNLLIFDEVFDSSLDGESADVLSQMLVDLEDGVNTIVISHRDIQSEYFDRTIRAYKVRDFTQYEITT